MAETRTSIVIVGWDGRSSGSRTAVFGTVLDQLLEQTKQTVIVAKMGHPLNTTSRLVLVVPPTSDHHPGFTGGVSLMKHLAAEVDARLEVLVVEDDPGGIRRPSRRPGRSTPSPARAWRGGVPSSGSSGPAWNPRTWSWS
jgi:hypothetical protein